MVEPPLARESKMSATPPKLRAALVAVVAAVAVIVFAFAASSALAQSAQDKQDNYSNCRDAGGSTYNCCIWSGGSFFQRGASSSCAWRDDPEVIVVGSGVSGPVLPNR
jgi:uncharacterized membrane protein